MFWVKTIFPFINKHRNTILFSAFLSIYLLLGMYILLYNDIIINEWDIIFDADSPRVYWDFFSLDANHYRVGVHPFMLMLLQPIFNILKGLFVSQRFTLIFVQSIVVSLLVILIKEIMFRLIKNEKLSFLVSIIFGISFSSLIFVAIPETYIFGSLFVLLLLKLVLDIKERNSLRKKDILTLSLLSISAFGIIPVLIIPVVFLLFYLLTSLYAKYGQVLKRFFQILLVMLVCYFSFSFLQKLSFPNSPIFFKGVAQEDVNYINKDNSSNKVQNIIIGFFVQPIYSLSFSNVEFSGRSNGLLRFSGKDSPYKFIPSIFLFLFPLIYGLINKKNLWKYKKEFIYLSIILISFMVCNYYYGNSSVFLYSQNFLIYIVILLGLLYSFCSEKIINIVLPIFITYQGLINFVSVNKVANFASFNAEKHCNFFILILFSLIVTMLFLVAFNLGKRFIVKYGIRIGFEDVIYGYYLIVFIAMLFLALFHGRV